MQSSIAALALGASLSSGGAPPAVHPADPPLVVWLDTGSAARDLRGAFGGRVRIATTPLRDGGIAPSTLDSLLSLDPVAWVVPFPVDSAEAAAWPLARSSRAAIASRAGRRPALFAAATEPADSASWRRMLGWTSAPADSELRLDAPRWDTLGVAFDSSRIRPAASKSRGFLLPFSDQDGKCLRAVAAALREALPASSRIHPSGRPLRVVVDVGHYSPGVHLPGGPGPGALSPRGVHEFEVNLPMARRLASRLREDLGADVAIHNEDGSERTLRGRTEFARRWGADLFLSIHHDAVQDRFLHDWVYKGVRRAYNDDTRGFCLFVHDSSVGYPQALSLAREIGRSLRAAGMVPNLSHADPVKGEGRQVLDSAAGVLSAPFGVLASARMPAILLECGVLINRKEERKLESDAFRIRFSRAVSKAVGRWIRRGAPDDPTAPPRPLLLPWSP